MAVPNDPHLLVPKALYFLCSCFMYAPALFQAKYLEDTWKIASKNYGYMNLVTVFSILASLTWSGFADRYRAHKQVLMIKSLLYGLSYCTMWFLEPFMANWSLQLKMGVITGLFFTTTVFCSAIFPLLGTLVFSILENSQSLRDGTIPPKRLLGRQKLFGTLGLGLVYALNGTLTDFIGFRAQFLIVSVSCIFFFLIAHFGLERLPSTTALHVKPPTPYTVEKVEIKTPQTVAAAAAKPSWTRNVRALLGNWEFVNLLVIVLLIGMVGSVFNVYFAIFMGKVLADASWKNILMGMMTTVRLVVEIPIYIWGDSLIGRFGSYGVLLMGMAASAIRPFGYAAFVKDESSAKWGFVFELFKGFSHACNGLGGCVLASDLAPAGAQGTAQALFTSAHHHAASVISGLLCTLFLTMRHETTASIAEKIVIYRELFFWTGMLGILGTLLNIYRLLKNQSKDKLIK